MFSSRQITYKIMVASAMLAPTWGCSGEPPPTPPDIQKEAGDVAPPEIDLGTADEDGSEKKEGSDTK